MPLGVVTCRRCSREWFSPERDWMRVLIEERIHTSRASIPPSTPTTADRPFGAHIEDTVSEPHRRSDSWVHGTSLTTPSADTEVSPQFRRHTTRLTAIGLAATSLLIATSALASAGPPNIRLHRQLQDMASPFRLPARMPHESQPQAPPPKTRSNPRTLH